jgi:2-succinyl-6-hydroxy-2,4-cyclohexadiene-1-carboxylate synthase
MSPSPYRPRRRRSPPRVTEAAAAPPGRGFHAVPRRVPGWGTLTAWVAGPPEGRTFRGSPPRVPLVLLHGFSGSAHAWGAPLLEALAADRTVVAVDLPGHGASAWPTPDEGVSVPSLAAVLAELLHGWIAGGAPDGAAAGGRGAGSPGEAVWVGYSMGGRVALALGVEHPGVVAALILESGSPGLATEGERVARAAADEALAASLRSRGMEAFVDAWLALPLFDGLRALPEPERRAERLRRLGNRPEALSGVLRRLGTGSQPDYDPFLPALPFPTLLLAGGADAKFSRITREMALRMPGARRVEFPQVGHVPHREAPAAWLQAVAAFLDEVDGLTGPASRA